MHRFLIQHQNSLIRLIGYILVPAVLLIPALIYGKELNVTGLLSFPLYRAACFCMLGWLLFLLKRCAPADDTHLSRDLCILAALIVTALVLPYRENENMISGLHIAVSYAAFVMMNVILYRIWHYDVKAQRICFAVSAFCFMHAMVSMQVTMLSECVYACMINVLLVNKVGDRC